MLIQDLKFAWRQMLGHRGFALVVIVTLALSIGAATAVFGLFDAVLLRPFPFREPQQLVKVRTYEPGIKGTTRGASVYDFADYQRQNKSFSSLAEYITFPNTMTGSGDARVVTMTFASAGLFSVLGMHPAVGRAFTPEEDLIGGDVRQAVLSDGLWLELFNRDPNAIGRTIHLRGESYTVIGVMPVGFAYPERTEIWVPLMARYAAYKDEFWKRRETHMHDVLGRLLPGVRIEQAQADMSTVAANVSAQFPVDKDIRLEVLPLREAETGVLRPYVLVVGLAVLLLLLIGSINVAGLFVARAAERERELAVRMAIGMTRWRLFRQLVSESLLYCVIGCSGGVAIAALGLIGLRHAIPVELPSWMEFRMDWRILAFSIGVSLLTAVAFGLVPMLQQRENNLNDVLKTGSKGSSGSSSIARRLRGGLLITEVSFSVILLAGAGLMLHSFQKLLQVDTGVRTEHLIVANLHRYLPNATKEQQLTGYADQHYRIAQRLLSLPGVHVVSGSDDLPLLKQPEERQAYEIYTPLRATKELAYRGPSQGGDIMPGYFSTLGIPLLEGRDFTEGDTLGSQPVMIISKRAASILFPGDDALGRTIRWGGPSPDNPWITIIGVCGDTIWNPAERNPGIEVYWSYRQYSSSSMFLVVKSDVPFDVLAPEIRNVVKETSPEMAIDLLKEYGTIAKESVWQRRLWSFVLSAFATLALALTAIGLYGVLSYMVSQQKRDLGIRMAIGAQRVDIFRIVMTGGLRLVAIGGSIGLIAAVASAHALHGVLFGVTTLDSMTYAAIVLLILLVSASACALPALRATRIDPMIALRD